MNENTNTPGPTHAETLRGGVTLELQRLAGETISVFVRQLPLGEMEALLKAQGNEVKLALLYTTMPGGAWPEGWFDALTTESQERIVEEGDRLNASPFSRWFKRRLDRQERMVPGSTARLFAVLEPEPKASPSSPPPRVVPAG